MVRNWSATDTGTNNIVRALVVDSNNNIYAGGLFTTAGGITLIIISKMGWLKLVCTRYWDKQYIWSLAI